MRCPVCNITLLDGECPMTCTYCNRHDCECEELKDQTFVPLPEDEDED
jgi:hypothetical protein